MADPSPLNAEIELDAIGGPRDACCVCGGRRSAALELFRCWGKWYCRDRVECYQRSQERHP